MITQQINGKVRTTVRPISALSACITNQIPVSKLKKLTVILKFHYSETCSTKETLFGPIYFLAHLSTILYTASIISYFWVGEQREISSSC